MLILKPLLRCNVQQSRRNEFNNPLDLEEKMNAQITATTVIVTTPRTEIDHVGTPVRL